jgi:hypothetical protein
VESKITAPNFDGILAPHADLAWQLPANPSIGPMNILSDSLQRLEARDPSRMTNLRSGESLVLASDYGGDHKGARFRAFSFLLANRDALGGWLNAREQWRRRRLRDGRRMSFTQLGDRHRREALPEFLEIARTIPGILASVLVDRAIQSVFSERGDLDMPRIASLRSAGWSTNGLERLFTIVHFASFFLAGFSRAGQNVLWVSDEDEIAANEPRLRQLTETFGIVFSHYLQHDLGHVRVGTMHSDNGSRELEDLGAIPDLAAGALSEIYSAYRNQHSLPGGPVIVPVPDAVTPKSRQIMRWLSEEGRRLSKIVFVVRPPDSGSGLHIQLLRLHQA